MALTNVINATEDGKIAWKLHDNGVGYWAVVDSNWRLDLVEGVYTLRKDGVVLDSQNDTNNVLKDAIEDYIETTKSNLISEFTTKISNLGE